ncbi:MAG TPA: hypothetical protein VFH36_13050 [Acidimicrobiales bacterium]|nr:hypothetical protein [Acidimicrobiales bacterium]
MEPLARLGAERIGAGQPLAVAEQGQEAVGLGVRTCVGGRLGHLGHGGGGAEPGLGRADRRGLRVGEHDAGHGLVVGPPWLAEDVGGDDVALVLADVGEGPDAVDVADGPQALAGAQVRVDRDPVAVGLDTDGLQAQPVHAGAATGGDQQAVASQLAAVRELQDVVLALAPGRRGVHAQDELDAVAAQGLAERFAQRRGLAGEHVVGAVRDGDLAAEAAHGLRHLDADRPGAEHEQAAGDGSHAGRLAAAPEAVELAQTRDGRHDRIGTIRQHDVLGGVAHPVDLDHARPGEPARAAQQVDARPRQPALLAGVGVVRDHEVTPPQRGLDVDLGVRRGVARGMHRLAGAQQGLGRDARPVGALAPDQLTLDDRDTQSTLGQRAGAVLARRAAAEDDDVVVAGHEPPPCPSMWSAASSDASSGVRPCSRALM